MTAERPRFSTPYHRNIDVFQLTPNQLAVLKLRATGLQYSRIAELLDTTTATVSKYFPIIHDKLGAKSGLDAVLKGIARGLISLEESIAGHEVPDPDLSQLTVPEKRAMVLYIRSRGTLTHAEMGNSLGYPEGKIDLILSSVRRKFGVQDRDMISAVLLCKAALERNDPRTS